LPEERIKKFLINREIVLKGKPDKVRDLLSASMKNSGFRFNEVSEDKGYQFYAQKGRYSRLGVFVTHLSILIILVGAVVGMRFGFKGYMEIPEGTVSNTAYSGTDRQISLDFSVRCDNFDVEFYGGSDMPKEYKSWLTVIKNDREILRKSIAVNDPLTYEGVTFYQSSYGLLPDGLGRGIFIFNVGPKDGNSTTLNLRYGDTFQIPNTGITGKILNFSPALKIDEHGHLSTYANQMNNPAVLIEFSESGKQKGSGWILKRHPETWQLPWGDRVEFVDYWGVEYTGLQVRKDPGVWVVYLGCIIMSLGLFAAFFMSHRRIWVKAVEEKNSTKVVIGATCNKNRAAFERKIDRMISVLGREREGAK
jgi:cytochrome c biogenesis protein